MAYISQADKKTIASNLAPVLKKYGMKGTLRIRNHSSIVLTLRSGKIDLIANSNAVCGNSHYQRASGFKPNTTGHCDVNPYWFHDHYDGVAKEFLIEAFQALKSANWYDNTNSQIDYFDTAYYVDVQIGKFDSPFIVTT